MYQIDLWKLSTHSIWYTQSWCHDSYSFYSVTRGSKVIKQWPDAKFVFSGTTCPVLTILIKQIIVRLHGRVQHAGICQLQLPPYKEVLRLLWICCCSSIHPTERMHQQMKHTEAVTSESESENAVSPNVSPVEYIGQACYVYLTPNSKCGYGYSIKCVSLHEIKIIQNLKINTKKLVIFICRIICIIDPRNSGKVKITSKQMFSNLVWWVKSNPRNTLTNWYLSELGSL